MFLNSVKNITSMLYGKSVDELISVIEKVKNNFVFTSVIDQINFRVNHGFVLTLEQKERIDSCSRNQPGDHSGLVKQLFFGTCNCFGGSLVPCNNPQPIQITTSDPTEEGNVEIIDLTLSDDDEPTPMEVDEVRASVIQHTADIQVRIL